MAKYTIHPHDAHSFEIHCADGYVLGLVTLATNGRDWYADYIDADEGGPDRSSILKTRTDAINFLLDLDARGILEIYAA